MKNIPLVLFMIFSPIIACELPGPQQDEQTQQKEQQMAQPEMIKIAGGTVDPFGTRETVTVPSFHLDKHLVTYQQYNQFIEDGVTKRKNIGQKKVANSLKNTSSGYPQLIMRNILIGRHTR